MDESGHSQGAQAKGRAEARPKAKAQEKGSTMTIRTAIYARVSTTNHGQDVSLQTRELRQFAEARGWQIAGEYVDAGVSGAKDSRPELNRMMADAHNRRFDVVVVWRFDRFARSVSHLLRALETFNALGIAFVRAERTDGHHDAGGQHGLHRLGRRGRIRSKWRLCCNRLGFDGVRCAGVHSLQRVPLGASAVEGDQG
jgi:hypothetical protein